MAGGIAMGTVQGWGCWGTTPERPQCRGACRGEMGGVAIGVCKKGGY